MTDQRTLTGMEHAFVNVAPSVLHPDGVAHVVEGQALPDDVSANELARLDRLGAFGEHPRDVRARQIEEEARVAAATSNLEARLSLIAVQVGRDALAASQAQSQARTSDEVSA